MLQLARDILDNLQNLDIEVDDEEQNVVLYRLLLSQAREMVNRLEDDEIARAVKNW